jgi:cytochrome c
MLCYRTRRLLAPRFIIFNIFRRGSPMFNIIRFAVAATFLSLLTAQTRAEGGNPVLGQRLAQEWCAKCHAIGLVGTSPLAISPPFRELHTRYNVEDLEESLAEGILVGHPTMPAFRFDPDQVSNLIAYLKTLEK